MEQDLRKEEDIRINVSAAHILVSDTISSILAGTSADIPISTICLLAQA